MVEQPWKKNRFRNILPHPEPEDHSNVTTKNSILPRETFGENKSTTGIVSGRGNIEKFWP